MHPTTTQPSLDQQRTRVGLNPFAHFIQGAKNVFSTNFLSLVAIAVISILVSTIFSLIFVLYVFTNIASVVTGGTNLVSFIGALLAGILVLSIIGGYFSLATNKPILDGSKKIKVSAGDALQLAWKRLPLAVMTYLVILALFAIVLILIAVLGSTAPIAGLVAGLVAIVAGILFAFRIIMLPFVLVDTQKPAGPMTAIRGSARVWNSAKGAIVLYVITMFLALIIISSIFSNVGTNPTSNTSTTTSPNGQTSFTVNSDADNFTTVTTPTSNVSTAAVATGTVATLTAGVVIYFLVQAIVQTLIVVIGYSGLARIYVQARTLLGDTDMIYTNPVTASTPLQPQNGSPVAPTNVTGVPAAASPLTQPTSQPASPSPTMYSPTPQPPTPTYAQPVQTPTAPQQQAQPQAQIISPDAQSPQPPQAQQPPTA